MIHVTCNCCQGPSPNTVIDGVSDFFALELQAGKLHVFLNSWRGVLDRQLDDEKEHSVELQWSNKSISVKLDGGLEGRCYEKGCLLSVSLQYSYISNVLHSLL